MDDPQITDPGSPAPPPAPAPAPASASASVSTAGHEPDIQMSLANERTFLAWIRTALGLVTAGLAITQLLPSLDFPGARRLLGLPLIGLGVVISVVCFWEWRANQHALRFDLPLPRSYLPVIVAGVVGLVAVIGLVLVIVEGSGS
jgi:putative membrane protein